MKKIILLILLVTLSSCYKTEDPLKYKGCIVIELRDNMPICGNVVLKLSPHFRDSLNTDYMLIGVPKWEREKLHVGDTIQ